MAGGLEELSDIEAIVRLKHAYFRLLDTKRFEELGDLLTEDATSAFESGKLSHEGRQAIVAFLGQALGRPDIVTVHHGHHPEIDVTSAGTATGTWYLEDRVIVHDQNFELHGTALYRDEYRKENGRWRISHTGYERIFEEQLRRGNEVVKFTTRFAPDPKEPGD